MSIIITIIALSIVIFIHELGHLLAAKWAKIGVYEFAVGMGPKIIGRKWGETEYTLRLFPIGGFVKLAGMDDAPEGSPFTPDQDLYAKKPFPRFVTISAGSVFNIILGFAIFVLVYSGLGIKLPTTTIQTIIKNTPAEHSLQVGDTILAVNQMKVSNGTQIIDALQAAPKGTIELLINRDGDQHQIPIIPIHKGDRAVIGIMFGQAQHATHLGPVDAIKWGLLTTQASVVMVFQSLKIMISGDVKAQDMAGVVGIVQMAASGYEQGLDSFLKFMAMISISLGVFNLFPLPALDGGHLFFLGIETLRGKPLNRKWETLITNIGFAILMTLMVFILINDVIQWTDRNKQLNSNSSTR